MGGGYLSQDNMMSSTGMPCSFKVSTPMMGPPRQVKNAHPLKGYTGRLHLDIAWWQGKEKKEKKNENVSPIQREGRLKDKASNNGAQQAENAVPWGQAGG